MTSKPDLYPLVFSYPSDGSKNGNGANYLMVQYFRNYIVRPIGSLSGTSTVDSLSSSFICTANEANTLVPPPYSSAASPDDLSMSIQNYAIPRSASQQGYMNETLQMSEFIEHQQQRNNCNNNTGSSRPGAFIRPSSVPNTTNQYFTSVNANMHQFRASESANFTNLLLTNHNNMSNSIEENSQTNQNTRNNCILIHQVPMSSTSTIATSATASSKSNPNNNHSNSNNNTSDEDFSNSYGGVHFNDFQSICNNINSSNKLSSANNDGTQQSLNFTSSLNNNNVINYIDDNTTGNSIYHSSDTVSSLSAAMALPVDRRNGKSNDKLTLIQIQLEKCCQMIQLQAQQQEQLKRNLKTTTPCSNFDSASASPVNMDVAKKMGENGLMSYMNSNTGSTVSSLANLNSPGSPPQATSPTQEVKDLLEQIRQLKATSFESNESLHEVNMGKYPSEESINNEPIESVTPEPTIIKRPTTLNNKRKFFNLKNKAVYLPISNNTFNNSNSNFSSNISSSKMMRSPISNSSMGILGKGRSLRGKNGWISKSAPTTPGTSNGLPVNFMGDDSPLLLNEQDEDNEHEQN